MHTLVLPGLLVCGGLLVAADCAAQKKESAPATVAYKSADGMASLRVPATWKVTERTRKNKKVAVTLGPAIKSYWLIHVGATVPLVDCCTCWHLSSMSMVWPDMTPAIDGRPK